MKSTEVELREIGSRPAEGEHQQGRFAHHAPPKMRLPIRVQLTTLILLSSLIGLAVISIAVWVVTHDFVLSVRASRLSLTASLKAAQLASSLNLMQTSANLISTRILIQRALMRYNYAGNNTAENWSQAQTDLAAAIGGDGSLGQTLLLQTMVFPQTASGPGGPYGLLNTTAAGSASAIVLPYRYPNGTHILLGANDSDAGSFGFPPPLYPNLTYFSEPYNSTFNLSDASFEGDTLTLNSTLLLGPWFVNETLSLVSLTVPIVNNTSAEDVIGWLTAVMDAVLIENVIATQEGLDESGETLVIAPATGTNLLPANFTGSTQASSSPQFDVQFISPLNASYAARHPDHVQGVSNPPFPPREYPTLFDALAAVANRNLTPYGSNLRAVNENGEKVSVGWAVPQTNIVDWVVMVEQSRGEVWAPINHLRDIILTCLFATVGFMAVISFPLAHFASLPILRLREATVRSVAPHGTTSRSSLGSFGSDHDAGPNEVAESPMADASGGAEKSGFVNHRFSAPAGRFRWSRRAPMAPETRREERAKRGFRIPGKVKERKYWIADELSELTQTFNEMSDELMSQYSQLEQRVQERTAELEKSKEAAEVANESKTLFIANISHELKTPLNGILGMAAVCMQEDDQLKLKRSLGIIYKSGDLLLNLLNDLLTFSKNQIGQHLTLDEGEFRLRDVCSQILAIFDKQATDGKIDLTVECEGVPLVASDNALAARTERGPMDTGIVRDMLLWGDIHRILQVVINLVSNSLKFTPAGGSVRFIIRCLPEAPPDAASRAGSMNSKQSWRSRKKYHSGSEATVASSRGNNVTAGHVKERLPPLAHASAPERAASPPPGKFLYLEFEVTDTGPGIAEHQQQKIFEPFVQGDLGLSRRFGGTGLGLSICAQLAKLMHGSIRLHSVEGHGATFTMKIPLRHIGSRADSTAGSIDLAPDAPGRSRRSSVGEEPPSVAPGADDRRNHLEVASYPGSSADPYAASKTSTLVETMPSDAKPRLVGLRTPFFASSQPMESPGSQPEAIDRITAEATRGGRIRVLVAEDNKVNQEVVLRMLKLEDIYDVTVAQDGREALDLVKESMKGGLPFNLIFMDIQMPVYDGLQSTRLIREIGYQAPIVALTAFSEESNIKDCLDSGMNYFLSKPIKRPMLKKVLKEYCTPIPEEEECSEPSPGADDHVAARSSSVNTTLVMVNGQIATGHPGAPPTGAAPSLDDAISAPPVSALDGASRPVSPCTKE